ncbi:MAG: class E sortase, partial [Actinobacteria bacterium]|nr:class E sortase [Actinomycetota bacterium]
MLSRILGGVGRVLIFAGVVLLLFVAYQLWGTALD